jgi:truncated hemoglobin YjbI
MSKQQLKALFQTIGGEQQLKEILRDFYNRMSTDILIGYFFDGKDVMAIADRQKEFLMYAMSASPSYEGKLPTSAHLELPPVWTGHFDRRLLLLKETLKDHGLTQAQIDIWIQFEDAFRSVIIEDEKSSKPKS